MREISWGLNKNLTKGCLGVNITISITSPPYPLLPPLSTAYHTSTLIYHNMVLPPIFITATYDVIIALQNISWFNNPEEVFTGLNLYHYMGWSPKEGGELGRSICRHWYRKCNRDRVQRNDGHITTLIISTMWDNREVLTGLVLVKSRPQSRAIHIMRQSGLISQKSPITQYVTNPGHKFRLATVFIPLI